MKKLLSLYRIEMVRPTIYQGVRRGSIALAVVLLWLRYINHGARNGLSNGTFAAGAVFLGMAWRYYLRLDGLQMHYMLEEKRKKPKRHSTADIVDFVDEHIENLDELDDDERLACGLASSLALGILFVAASLIVWALG